jgi:hypothetical protein
MAGIDTTSIMSCTYGTAGFMLTRLSVGQTPRVTDGQGRQATEVMFDGEGHIDDKVPADFYAKVAAVNAAMQRDGQTFAVTAGSQTVFLLASGSCLDGGPFCEFTIADGIAACHKIVRFKLRARLAAPLGQVFRLNTTIMPDGRQRITQSGTFSGEGAWDAAQGWLGTFRSAYAPQAGSSITDSTATISKPF